MKPQICPNSPWQGVYYKRIPMATNKLTVLISPSLHTGLDLKDELSRFQIITKVPYPNKSDRWTNAKRVADSEWYYWQTALKLIQAYGRSVRSKDDWARTYILDSASGYYVIRIKTSFQVGSYKQSKESDKEESNEPDYDEDKDQLEEEQEEEAEEITTANQVF